METNTDARNFKWYEQLKREMENLGYEVLIRGDSFWVASEGKLMEACSSVAELAVVFRCLKRINEGKWILCDDKIVRVPDEAYRISKTSDSPP